MNGWQIKWKSWSNNYLYEKSFQICKTYISNILHLDMILLKKKYSHDIETKAIASQKSENEYLIRLIYYSFWLLSWISIYNFFCVNFHSLMTLPSYKTWKLFQRNLYNFYHLIIMIFCIYQLTSNFQHFCCR